MYVTDYNNHRVQLFSADGQFISSFGSKGSQPGQLCHPHGMYDSTDTVYVSDRKHRVSHTHERLLKCFGERKSGEGEHSYPVGMGVDNTTGNLYICDYYHNCVVVYYSSEILVS